MNAFKSKIIEDAKEYLNSVGFKEDTGNIDGDYAIYKSGSVNNEYMCLVFRQKGNRKHIDYFISQGWRRGKSYRNFTGSPSMWEAEGWTYGCSTGVFMATLEYPLSLFNIYELNAEEGD